MCVGMLFWVATRLGRASVRRPNDRGERRRGRGVEAPHPRATARAQAPPVAGARHLVEEDPSAGPHPGRPGPVRGELCSTKLNVFRGYHGDVQSVARKGCEGFVVLGLVVVCDVLCCRFGEWHVTCFVLHKLGKHASPVQRVVSIQFVYPFEWL